MLRTSTSRASHTQRGLVLLQTLSGRSLRCRGPTLLTALIIVYQSTTLVCRPLCPLGRPSAGPLHTIYFVQYEVCVAGGSAASVSMHTQTSGAHPGAGCSLCPSWPLYPTIKRMATALILPSWKIPFTPLHSILIIITTDHYHSFAFASPGGHSP